MARSGNNVDKGGDIDFMENKFNLVVGLEPKTLASEVLVNTLGYSWIMSDLRC